MQVYRPDFDVDVEPEQRRTRLFERDGIEFEQRWLHGDSEHAIRRGRQPDRDQRRRGNQQREQGSGQPASKEHASRKANPVPEKRGVAGRIPG